ncbi:hypothetical protein [Bacillus velezensis]|uniref:hypothetical protein n=1 Tax=Bacillus velezensis TaxID=492670 RepID=UPI000C762CB1|nr:hypothetical protein [Bacillus velezensis]AUJ62602.1 hypothetical protein B6257_19370 [Bacillus velezensis]
MICDRERLAHFLQQLKALSSSGGFTKSDLLTPEFHLAKDGDLDMYDSPHNEYINPHAAVVISGITPGFFQMQRAYKAAAQLLKNGESLEVIAYETKKAACRMLKKNGRMGHAVILEGFPHPSGANGHRFKQFHENQQLLREQIQRFAGFLQKL